MGLTGCQELPQPFRHEGAAPALAVPEQTSIAEIHQEEANPAAPETPAAKPHRPTLRIENFPNLPGDGAQSLRRALKSALERRGILVVGEGGDAVVRLHVTQTAGGEGAQVKLAFRWEAVTPDGKTFGTVDQQGQAKQSEISGPWGGLAKAIADGGAEGLAQLVIKMTPIE